MYTHPKLILSNAIWLAPAAIAYIGNVPLLALPALIIMFLSGAYHATGNPTLELLDTVFALGYMAIGPILLYFAGNPPAGWLLAITACIIAFSIFRKAKVSDSTGDRTAYQLWHSLWHISAASVSSIIYLFYVLSL